MAPPRSEVHVDLLGPLAVTVDARPVALPSGHQRRLMVALALVAGSVVSVERLVAVLWGQRPPASAHNSLQSHLARLRRVLGDAGLVTRDGPGYVLHASPQAVDAVRFERLCTEAGRAPTPADRLALLDAALALWRGELPWADDDELADAAVRLAQRRLAALCERAEATLAVGDVDRSIEDLRSVLAVEPLREPAVALLVRALAAAGRSADADAAFQRYRDRLADGLGLDPSTALQDVHRALLRGELQPERASADPATPSPTAPSNAAPSRVASSPAGPAPAASLPTPRSAFLGRADDLAALRDLTASRRCVTVLGPGGVGKTRLAIELARDHVARGDVLWVELLDARTVPDVLGRIALAAGSGTPRDLVTLSPLSDALEHFDGLVVLDNCEQAANEVATVVERLVAVTDDVRVVATSRVPLHVDAERLVRLAPLPTSAAPAPDGTSTSPATQLLVDRAQGAIDPTDPRQRAAADEVTRRLDGLPLAIELAARHVRNLGLVVVRDRLDQRLELLRAGRNPDHPAHSDLRSLVAWSTQQLDDVERGAFRWLGLYAGPFTLAQAEQLLVQATVPPARVGAVVANLVEQSLVVRDGTRFRMLETLRLCAVEELEATGALAQALVAHAEAVIACTEAAASRLMTRDEAAAVADLHHLVADLQAVNLRLAEQRDVERLCRMAAAIHVYAYHTQRLELLACARTAADLLDGAGRDAVPDDLAVHARAAAGIEAWWVGDPGRAVRLAELAVATSDTPTQALACAHELLGDVRLTRGDGDAATAYQRCLELAQSLDLPAMVVAGWTGLALVRAFTGDDAASRAAVAEAEASARRLRIPTMAAWAACARGEAEARRDPAAALQAFEVAIDTARTVDNRLVAAAAATGAAAIRARHGDPAPALAALEATIAGWRRSGRASVQRGVLRNLAVLLARVGQDEAAATLLGATEASRMYEAERQRVAQALAAVTERLGTVATQRLRQRGAGLDHDELTEVALAAVTAAGDRQR